MSVCIILANQSAIIIPFLFRKWHQIIFICHRPPHVVICTVSRHHILQILLITSLLHSRKSPFVIRVKKNNIRFNPKVSELSNLVVHFFKICRIWFIKIKVSDILRFFCLRKSNWNFPCSLFFILPSAYSSFKRIILWFILVELIIFGKYAETYFIETAVLQSFQCLTLQFLCLIKPGVTGSSNTVINSAICICQISTVFNLHRAMISTVCGNYLKFTLIFVRFLIQLIISSFNFISIMAFVRRHKTNLVNVAAIIKAFHFHSFLFPVESRFQSSCLNRL